MKKSYFKLPNCVVTDKTLSYSARHIAAVLYSRRNTKGECSKSLEQLCKISSYSLTTVVKAIRELVDRGYLTVQKSYRYRETLGRVGCGRNTYCMNPEKLKGNYTLVDRQSLQNGLKESAMTVYLYLLTTAGKRNRAWPSIRMMADAVGMAQSTICEALKRFKAMSGIIVENCIKRNGVFASNSYFLNVQRVKCTLLQKGNGGIKPSSECYHNINAEVVKYPPITEEHSYYLDNESYKLGEKDIGRAQKKRSRFLSCLISSAAGLLHRLTGLFVARDVTDTKGEVCPLDPFSS